MMSTMLSNLNNDLRMLSQESAILVQNRISLSGGRSRYAQRAGERQVGVQDTRFQNFLKILDFQNF